MWRIWQAWCIFFVIFMSTVACVNCTFTIIDFWTDNLRTDNNYNHYMCIYCNITPNCIYYWTIFLDFKNLCCHFHLLWKGDLGVQIHSAFSCNSVRSNLWWVSSASSVGWCCCNLHCSWVVGWYQTPSLWVLGGQEGAAEGWTMLHVEIQSYWREVVFLFNAHLAASQNSRCPKGSTLASSLWGQWEI